MKGILLHVFRATDTSSDVITYDRDHIFVKGPGIPEILNQGPWPEFVLQSHTPGCVRLIPVLGADMVFGGNYASTQCGAFYYAIQAMLDHPFYGAVAIHDRKAE